MKRKGKFKQAAVMWIRDGVLINRMPINAVAFAYAYFLSAPAVEQDSLNVTSLVNFAFARSGISCLEKMTLWRSLQNAPDIDLEAAVSLYNAVATESACSASYFDGAIETLSWLKTCGASNFITSAVEQEVLDAWANSPQGRQICSRSGPISEILGRRPNFCKGRDHFQYVSEWLTKTAYQPESELIKTIYYVADAVSEIKQGREFSAEFSIVPIGFAHHIDSAQVLAAASSVGASLEKLLASGAVSQVSSSLTERLCLDERQLELPSAAALEASLRQAGAAHVVRNFDELRSSLDPQFASRRLHSGKTVKTRPLKPITMVVWALFMTCAVLFCSILFCMVEGVDRGTPQLIEYATDVIDRARIRLVDADGLDLGSISSPYTARVVNEIYLDNKLLYSQLQPKLEVQERVLPQVLPSSRAFDSDQLGIRNYGSVALKDGRQFISGGIPIRESRCSVPGFAIETFRSDQTFFFDPATGKFSPGPNLLQPRLYHSMTLLHDGRVLITGGGWLLNPASLRQAEIFDPRLNTVVFAGLMAKPRENHAVLELKNGKTLIVGGRTARKFSDAAESLTSVVELYDPTTSIFTVVGQLHYAREGPSLVPFGTDGAVISLGVTDVYRDDAGCNCIAPVEYYDGTKTSAAKSVFHTPSLGEVLYCLFNIGRKE